MEFRLHSCGNGDRETSLPRGLNWPVDFVLFCSLNLKFFYNLFLSTIQLDAFAAFYRAGYYSAHPNIPEELPEPCKAFIKRCFEIDPEKRARADELLTDPFILMYVDSFLIQCQFYRWVPSSAVCFQL